MINSPNGYLLRSGKLACEEYILERRTHAFIGTRWMRERRASKIRDGFHALFAMFTTACYNPYTRNIYDLRDGKESRQR